MQVFGRSLATGGFRMDSDAMTVTLYKESCDVLVCAIRGFALGAPGHK